MNIHILLVGEQILPIYYAIKKHAPDKIYLIASAQSRRTAKRLKKTIEPSIPTKVEVIDAFALQQVEALCQSIIAKYPNSNFTFNLTGGTKLMAIAAYKVALQHGAQVEYITTENKVVSLETYKQEPLETTLDNEEIISLSGHKVIKKEHYTLETIAPLVVESLKIKSFIEHSPKVHDRLRRLMQDQFRSNEALLPIQHAFGDYTLSRYEGGGFMLSTKSGSVLLDLPLAEGFDLYYNALWWEILVTQQLLEWAEPKQREVWSGVETTSEESEVDHVKNEVDILVNLQTTLLFVECKSGAVKQEDIYKIAAVRKTYGGDMSKSLLVSYYPLDANLQNKCRDSNIEIFAPNKHHERIDHLLLLTSSLNHIEQKIRS